MTTECHTQEKLFARKEPYKKTLPFSHETHMKEDPPGMRMRCTGCHSYQGGEKHFDIDDKACHLCHFTPRKEAMSLADGGEQETGRCTLCHKDVEKKVRIYEKEFDHKLYEKLVLDKVGGTAKLECIDCHNNEIVHGLGEVEKDICYDCHDRVPEDYTSVKDMHRDHMLKSKVRCDACHQEIVHKVYKEDKELEVCHSCKQLLFSLSSAQKSVEVALDSTSVAGNNPSTDISLTNTSIAELVQREMMQGEGGKGVKGSPDPMSLATLSCRACHKAVLEGNGDYARVEPGVCNTCHEKGFEKIYKEQKELVLYQMEMLKKLLELAEESGRAEEVEVVEAKQNYEFIASDGSYGVHNIKYTKDLLEFSISELNESLGG